MITGIWLFVCALIIVGGAVYTIYFTKRKNGAATHDIRRSVDTGFKGPPGDSNNFF